MAYHYCNNHPKPLIFANGPYPCATCRQATLPAHGVVRFTHPDGNYTVQWHDAGEKLFLAVVFAGYTVLLGDDVLSYDTAAFSQDTLLRAPGGGGWTDSTLANRGGGFPKGNNNPGCLSNVRVALGRHGTAPQFGLVHVLAGHPEMFHDMRSKPSKVVPFQLIGLRDNLRNITEPKGVATGARMVAEQQNGNTAVHGVSATIHGFIVVNGGGQLVTGYKSNVSAGTLNLRKKIREW